MDQENDQEKMIRKNTPVEGLGRAQSGGHHVRDV